ncbi:MAG: phenylalanine--tRNA ligase subunit beta [Pyrinomonadaceae bacterium]
MLISYQWLQELTATRLSPSELRERLTMVGLAIDAVAEHDQDSVLDVEVPSNRPDCLSHIGIAREVSVIDRCELHLPETKSFPMEGVAADFTSVKVQDTALCPRYAARIVRGVRIGPAPDWLIQRLITIGQRPINNVADITNYVLHEFGQPLHAFDFQKLTGKRIVVRRAVAGEKLRTLDGIDRVLADDMLVIADANDAVALAGIMGGEDSEISEATTDVLIESAYFDPDSVRRTARRLGMDTEASRRFERGADCENALRAQERCVELICEIAGGVATTDVIDVYPHPVPTRLVSLGRSRVTELTSLRVEDAEVVRILAGLGFADIRQEQGRHVFRVPSWRIDVEQEEDLVEEVARHTGYDQIASALPPSTFPGEYQPAEMKLRALRRALNACGFNEAISFSFTAPQTDFDLVPEFSGDPDRVTLKNPIIEDAGSMRTTLLAGLLTAVRHNLNHGVRDVRLFETGRIFTGSGGSELPRERQSFAIAATGGTVEENRAQADREIDFYDVKGALEQSVAWMNLEPLSFIRSSSKHFRPGQAATIALQNGTPVGSIGRLADDIAAAYKFRQPVFVMELDLSTLLESPVRLVQYAPLPRFPAVTRDISLLVDRETSFAEILRVAKELNIEDCRTLVLVGIYEGSNIPDAKRSITLRVEYRSDERTLRDEEVEERHAGLTTSLLEYFAAEQR